MNTELTQAVLEIRSLAQERDWERTVNAADAVLAAPLENTVLLASSAEGDVGGLPRWIAETAPSLHLEKTALEASAGDPLAAAVSERILVLIECGKMLTSERVEAIAEICFLRPDGSYGIVIRGLEALENAEDLELVERGVYRLLVPEPKAEWNRQDLLPYGCYLWSDAAPPEFAAARIRRDREALAAWLRRPVDYREEQATRLALSVVDFAETQLAEMPAAPQEATPLSPDRIYKTLDELTDLRRRLLTRLDAEAPSIERQLTASLQTLEQDLLQGVRAYLEPRLPRFDPSRDEAKLKSVVSWYVSDAAKRWQQQAERTLLSRSDTIQTDLDTILHSIDWTVANAAARRDGALRDYPELLLDDLMQANELNILRSSAVAAEGFGIDRNTASGKAIRSVVAVAAIAAGGAVLLGLGPAVLIAAGATLAAGAVKYKEDLLLACEEMARKVIQKMFRDAVTAVQTQTRETLRPLRTRLVERFQTLEQMLDRALETSRGPALSAPSEDPDRRKILEIRRRIVAYAALGDTDRTLFPAADSGDKEDAGVSAADSGDTHNEKTPPFGAAEEDNKTWP